MPRPNGADWGHEADAAVLPGPFPLTDPLTDRGPQAVVKDGGTIGHRLPHGGELGRFTPGGGRASVVLTRKGGVRLDSFTSRCLRRPMGCSYVDAPHRNRAK